MNAQKWEYAVVGVINNKKYVMEALEEKGNEGWELVGVTRTSSPDVFDLFFKRPKWQPSAKL